MSTIPMAAIEAALQTFEGTGGHPEDVIEATILAALPHLVGPVAWTGSGSLSQIAMGNPGYIYAKKAEAHPIAVFLAPPATAVKVKQLEWSDDGKTYTSNDIYGVYDNGSNWAEDRFWYYVGGKRAAKFPSLEAAKAAAQADYEERILSAIEIT